MKDDLMHTYLIEPKAPLVVRSGRPFDGQAGADAARFPPPSTLAGTLRTAHAHSCGKALNLELANIAVAGPLPVKLDDNGQADSLLVPKPADAVYFRTPDKQARRLLRVAPARHCEGEGCDLPEGLLPVRLTEPAQGKPAGGPAWWSMEDLVAWRKGESPSIEQIERNGWTPAGDDIRTHVGIDRASQAAEAGRLFQTAGLGFWQKQENPRSFPNARIGLVGRIAGEIKPGVVTLGGERRLSALRPADDALWPSLPAGFVDDLRAAGGLSLTLLTPALFAQGWRPPAIPGLALRAAALGRWQPHSGWDLAKWQPRAGRKLVPAGAVYWYAIGDIADEALARLWLAPLGEHEQDRRDGFGLVLPSPWKPA
jgi:CRISPR-associated protein Cmr3